MSVNLSQEIRKYVEICKLLRQNFKDSKLALKELTQSGNFDTDFLTNVNISRTEESLINSVVEYLPTVVVLGKDHAAKLGLVNAMLGQSVFPVTLEDSLEGWRMIRLVYGINQRVSLSVAGNFEVVDPILSAVNASGCVAIADLIIRTDRADHAVQNAVLEVSLSHELLMSGWRILVSPTGSPCRSDVESTFRKYVENALPIFIYVLSGVTLTEEDVEHIEEHRQWAPHFPMLYFCPDIGEVKSYPNVGPDIVPNPKTSEILLKLGEMGCILLPTDGGCRTEKEKTSVSESELVYGLGSLQAIAAFARKVMSQRLLEVGTCLYEIHERILRMFTTYAFDIARDVLITPRRLAYVRTKEMELFETLSSIANKKQEEIEFVIQETVDAVRDPLLEEAENFHFQGIHISDSQESLQNPKELQICMEEIRELVLSKINTAVAGKLIGSVNCLRESFIGTLCRCVDSLELPSEGSYPSAAYALKQIFNAAYQIHLNAATSSSFTQIFYERLRLLVQSLRWSASDRVDNVWKRSIAQEMISSLSSGKLARNICSQFRDRLKHAHDVFLLSIRQLESKHTERLEKMEQRRLKVRRHHAPKIAKLALESASTRDLIKFGMPKAGREIGRGQYGVVYSCESWSGYSPCAIKSVVPPDEKHCNDLAMEFYYTRCVPRHPRIVTLYGSIIDYSYGDGNLSMGPAVLFVMERLPRDLHAALKVGLPWGSRLQIASDVVEGIRFLHSQGLVHRDIKLKNVLLDKNNRAKLTDLGFCKPEAMLSGSIVGTPIHMAPEIFTGQKYDHSVDIYAFGILFWFLCSGSIKLPQVFEPSMSKDMLKTSVRKGTRPERLPYFDEQCWSLMNACWSTEPYLRPLPGDIEPKLKEIFQNYKHGCPTPPIIRETEVHVGSLGGSPYVDLDILNR